MNDIQITGTIFNVREFKNKKMFRLGFYNGKNAKGEFNTNGYIDCKTHNNTEIKEKIEERTRVCVKGFLACDYWEHQGKKYSQLNIVANEVDKDYSKQTKPNIDKQWDEADPSDEYIPF